MDEMKRKIADDFFGLVKDITQELGPLMNNCSEIKSLLKG
jgi:hypothetical protein